MQVTCSVVLDGADVEVRLTTVVLRIADKGTMVKKLARSWKYLEQLGKLRR
jgi:hypothetical protein